MVMSELGATVSADWSRKRSCAWPLSVVTMRSSWSTSAPTKRARVAPSGGCPVAAGLTAAVTPTRFASAFALPHQQTTTATIAAAANFHAIPMVAPDCAAWHPDSHGRDDY